MSSCLNSMKLCISYFLLTHIQNTKNGKLSRIFEFPDFTLQMSDMPQDLQVCSYRGMKAKNKAKHFKMLFCNFVDFDELIIFI